MSDTDYKPYTIGELIDTIYYENLDHFEFNENMGGDCDCSIHTTMKTILQYWGE